jgi:hypothetical protein
LHPCSWERASCQIFLTIYSYGWVGSHWLFACFRSFFCTTVVLIAELNLKWWDSCICDDSVPARPFAFGHTCDTCIQKGWCSCKVLEARVG